MNMGRACLSAHCPRSCSVFLLAFITFPGPPGLTQRKPNLPEQWTLPGAFPYCGIPAAPRGNPTGSVHVAQ